ncbi:MAG: ABC transporter ATP-binding protein [Prevotella sp.]|nr:ABC transporter ATP-binding protein [Prevotella sp.]
MSTNNKITYSVRDLSFAYGKHEVLKGLSFDLHEGKITTLIGANGCGKSTLFNLMTKNLKPDNGKIILNGKNIENIRLKDFAKQTAIVHQYNTAPVDLTVEKLISYGRTPYHKLGMPQNAEEDEKKIQWAMEITNTLKLKDKPVAKLSGGQKQRVWIAMALAQDTKILFLDEPTTYLDIRYQLQILKLIKQLNREFGITIVMVLHDINQSLNYSDEIVAMKDGKIMAQGLPEEIITTELVQSVFDVDLYIQNMNGKPFTLTI